MQNCQESWDFFRVQKKEREIDLCYYTKHQEHRVGIVESLWDVYETTPIARSQKYEVPAVAQMPASDLDSGLLKVGSDEDDMDVLIPLPHPYHLHQSQL